jgi:site-specific recombinase XerD
LRFLYRVTLGRPDVVTLIPYGKKPRTLPAVLSRPEVVPWFAQVPQPVERRMVETAYACGLRASERLRLRVADIDSRRMLVGVRHGQGGKDRAVPLSPARLEALRAYGRRRRPTHGRFAGQTPSGQRSLGALQRLVRQAVRAAGFTKQVSLHTLRHRYATHLLEAGVDLLTIQRRLGHRDLHTTARSLHRTAPRLAQTAGLRESLPQAPAAAAAPPPEVIAPAVPAPPPPAPPF